MGSMKTWRSFRNDGSTCLTADGDSPRSFLADDGAQLGRGRNVVIVPEEVAGVPGALGRLQPREGLRAVGVFGGFGGVVGRVIQVAAGRQGPEPVTDCLRPGDLLLVQRGVGPYCHGADVEPRVPESERGTGGLGSRR